MRVDQTRVPHLGERSSALSAFFKRGQNICAQARKKLCSFDAGPIVAGCILGLVVESSEVSTSSRSGDGLSSGVVKHVEVDLYLSSGHASCTWLVARW